MAQIKKTLEAVVAAIGTFIVLNILILAFKQIITLRQWPATMPATIPADSTNTIEIKAIISFTIALFWVIFRGAVPSLRPANDAESNDPEFPEPGPREEPKRAPKPDPNDERLTDALVALTQMTARKEQYKMAYQQGRDRYQQLFSALVDGGVIKKKDLIHGLDAKRLLRRIWRNRTIRWVMVTSFLLAILYFALGQVQTYAYSRFPKGFLDNPPKYVLFLHTILMLIFVPLVTGAVYYKSRGTLTRLQNLSDGIAIGAVAVLIAGFALFLQLSPEDIRTLHDNGKGILPITSSYQPTVWEWRFVQRFVLFPVAGILGPAIVAILTLWRESGTRDPRAAEIV